MKLRAWNILLLLTVLTVPPTLFAQSGQGLEAREFGQGQPASVGDLPPGQLKRKIANLPRQAKGNALKWLQDFSFPSDDVNSLDVDAEGNVFYVDTLVVDANQQALAAPEVTAQSTAQATLDDAFVLHSKPGASNTVFIDFDGHVISGTAWGGGATYLAKPYNIEGSADTFSDEERQRIVDIWHRVSEDLAMFDIDVTTEEPASFDRYTGHVLVTHNMDETGKAMPSSGGGGVAYVNVFGRSDYHTTYSPALVYYNNLGGGGETYVAEASSHEFGHNLGLSHDGIKNGATYYAGHGSGLVSWAPIMGNSYYNNVTEWSKGEYTDANNTQDDLAIIEGKLGYAGDDHGDSSGSATPLSVDPDGSVVSSNPEHDPHNVLGENKGVIDDSSDVDAFSFVSGAGTVSLTVTPAWDAFYRSTSRRGANLDVRAELWNSSGGLVTSSDPTTDTQASISASVSAGSYYLLVSGVGNSTTPYSEYDSLGQYFINGSVPTAEPDDTPPTPSPMSFTSAPSATGEDRISMTAAVATDNQSAVQYQFRCVAGGPQGCVDSGWQSSRSYTATGLAGGTQYTYQVAARDQSGNETAPSASVSATTDEPPPYVDVNSSGETTVAGSVSGSYSATHANGGSTQSIEEVQSGGKPKDRHVYLEHRWNFNLPVGATATVHANAWMSGSNGSESFDLEVSTNNGGSFTKLMSINSTSSSNLQTAVIPGAPSGSVILRVKDTHHQSGYRTANTFIVDHLYIRVGNPPSDPPDAPPTGMTASAVSASQIDLSWNDNASNESSYLVERSPTGSAPWVGIAALPAGAESYSDDGLSASTTYYYRVSAENMHGSSAYATANATTQAGTPPPPEPSLELTASGYKSRARHGVRLYWDAGVTVNVYRDGSLVRSGDSDGFYDDFIGAKGGAAYEHQVCETGNPGNCSNVTITNF